MVSGKISKIIVLLRKLQNFLPRDALITMYKAFIRSHLDYSSIFYDKAYNMSFHQKLESIQYNACLAITGAIRSFIFLNLLDSTQTVFLTVAILRGLDWSHDSNYR